ncbi:hypothetical protein YC2023_111839 [Brassica napus]
MKLSASCVFDLPEKDGRSKRRRFLKEDDYNEASVIRLFNTKSSIPATVVANLVCLNMCFLWKQLTIISSMHLRPNKERLINLMSPSLWILCSYILEENTYGYLILILFNLELKAGQLSLWGEQKKFPGR